MEKELMEKELKDTELNEVAGGKVFKNKTTGKWHTNWHPAEEFNSKKDAKKYEKAYKKMLIQPVYSGSQENDKGED